MNKSRSGVDKKQGYNVPNWLWPGSNALPQFYKVIWEAVKEDRPSLGTSHNELLVDTNRVFPLLLTSQLPTEVLGYIWSLANQKYAGQLTEQELYVVLALIAVAQGSYAFNSLDVLHMLPGPPTPRLNVSLMYGNQTQVPTGTANQAVHEQNLHSKTSSISSVPVVNSKNGQFGGSTSHVSQAASLGTTQNMSGSIGSTSSKAQNHVNLSHVSGVTGYPGHGITHSVQNHGNIVSSSQTQMYETVVPSSIINSGYANESKLTVHKSSIQSQSPVDLNDDFTDFQSAPLPPPSLPNIDPKQGSAIGSRLANHNLSGGSSIKKFSEKNKKATLKVKTNVANMSGTKELSSPDRLPTMFPKCTLKNQTKTVVLKDTIIRNSEPPKSTSFVPQKLPEVPVTKSSKHRDEPSGSDLMNLNTVEDKYSALRSLVEEPILAENKTGSFGSFGEPVVSSRTSSFGDFVEVGEAEGRSIKTSSFGNFVEQPAESGVRDLKTTSFGNFVEPAEPEVQNFKTNSFGSFMESPEHEVRTMKTTSIGNFVEPIPVDTNSRKNSFGNFDEPSLSEYFGNYNKIPSEKLENLETPGTYEELEKAEDDFGDFISAEQPDLTSGFSQSVLDASMDLFSDFEQFLPSSGGAKEERSLVEETIEALAQLEIAASPEKTIDFLEEKYETAIDPEKVIQKEDTISINSVELSNGPGPLTRSNSVPSLDLKLFLPSNGDDEKEPENMHQLIYWEWKQYMESCVLLLQLAANIFTGITSEAVLQEVLNSAQGYSFLCNLAEVAAVCRRVNFSHKEMDINIMGFDDLLLDIDRIWAEMEPFYVNIPIVTELPVWPNHQGDTNTCSLCLTVITSGRIIFNDNTYHATCANLWLNCVNNNLPVLKYHPPQAHAVTAGSN